MRNISLKTQKKSRNPTDEKQQLTKKLKELKTKLNFKIFQNVYVYLTSVYLPVRFIPMP